MNFQVFKVDLENAEPEINCNIIANASLNMQEFQKNIYFSFIDYAKAFDCEITKNCGKFLKRWE